MITFSLFLKFLAFPVLHSCLDFFFFWNLLCFVLLIIIIVFFFFEILPQICETIIFWTLKHFQVIYQSHLFFFFFSDLSPAMLHPSVPIWTDYCCLLGASFSPPPVLDFQFPRSSVVFFYIASLFFWSTSCNMMVKLFGPWMPENMFILLFLYFQLIE